jgi:hypothetical protein
MAKRNNTFLIKRSNVPGKVPTNLEIGELALNTSDVKLYASGTTENQILQIGWDRLPFITGTTVEPSPIVGDKLIIWDASSATHKNVDWGDLPGAAGGEVNTASNIGVGSGIFSGKSGTDLEFYSLSGGSNTTLRLSNDTIVIDGLSSLSAFTLNDLSDVTTGIPSTPTVADDGRMLHYDFASGQWISDDTVNHGTVVINVKKSTAGTIAKGTPVYLVGFDSDLHTVETANATSSSTMPVIGFAAEELDNTNTKHVITFGKIQGIDTTSGGTLANGEVWNINDDLYVDVVTGELTKVRPTGASTQIQRIAKVLNVDASGGQLFIFNTARTAGLPNLTENNIWVGNSSNQPIETTIKYVTGGTLNSNSLEVNRTDTTNIFSISGGTDLSISEPVNGVFKIDSTATDTNDYVTGATLNSNSLEVNRTDTTNVFSISGGTNITISEPTTGVFKIDSTGAGGNATVDEYYYSFNSSTDNVDFFDDGNIKFSYDSNGGTGPDLEIYMLTFPPNSNFLEYHSWVDGGSLQTGLISTLNSRVDLWSVGLNSDDRLEFIVSPNDGGDYPTYKMTAFRTGSSTDHVAVHIQSINN